MLTVALLTVITPCADIASFNGESARAFNQCVQSPIPWIILAYFAAAKATSSVLFALLKERGFTS